MKTRTVTLGAATVAAGFFAALFIFADPAPPAHSEPVEGLRGRAQHIPVSNTNAQRIRVIDGDTLEDRTANVTYRIENIDTPETGSRARCTAERELGDRATRETRALIAGAANLEIRATGRTDRYERAIAFVLIDGRDLGETLIAEGLARPWRGRREPWCDAAGNLIR